MTEKRIALFFVPFSLENSKKEKITMETKINEIRNLAIAEIEETIDLKSLEVVKNTYKKCVFFCV